MLEERRLNHADSFLESCVKEFRLFIDTDSLLSAFADAFWEKIIPVLQQEEKQIVIPRCVLKEIKQYVDDPELCRLKHKPSLYKRAQTVLDQVAELEHQRLVEIFEWEMKTSVDEVFCDIFAKDEENNLMLITQNHRLTRRIIAIEGEKNRKKCRLQVAQIMKNGGLSFAYSKK